MNESSFMIIRKIFQFVLKLKGEVLDKEMKRRNMKDDVIPLNRPEVKYGFINSKSCFPYIHYILLSHPKLKIILILLIYK